MPRFAFEHDFGDRPKTAGIVEVQAKELIYPPVQSLSDSSIEFYHRYWLAVLSLAAEHDAIVPLNEMIGYPRGEEGNPWKGFVLAAKSIAGRNERRGHTGDG